MKALSPRCSACASVRLEQVVDLGPVPIAHRFLQAPAGPDEYKHPMVAHLCQDCGMIQILDPVPPERLYREYNFCFSSWKPQPHMADEIALIASRVAADEQILEIGSNDGTFLHELATAGLRRLAGVEPNPFTGAQARKTGAAIYEGFFDREMSRRLLAEGMQASLVVSRQTMEHITDLAGWLAGIHAVLKESGWLLIEVPDFDVPLAYGDVSQFWEEHVNYFTEETLRGTLRRGGFAVEEIRRYPFSGGALMALARRTAAPETGAQGPAPTIRAARAFAERASVFQRKVTARLLANRAAGVRNILYGTGCRANMLVNASKLQSLFDLVVDDQKEKHGFYMPGTSMKIQPASGLAAQKGDCFLAVNAENEPAVISRGRAFIDNGGRFLSLHSPSPLLQELDTAAAK